MVAPLNRAPAPIGPGFGDITGEGPAGGPGNGVTPTREPEEVLPQAARKRTTVVEKTKPTRRLEPGDLICGDCGEGNAPTRKFCSRCGNTLDSAVVIRPPWWKRLIPKRKPKVLDAGARPGQKGVKSRQRPSLKRLIKPVRRVASIILLVLTILYGLSATFRERVNSRWSNAKNRVESKINPDYLPVRPSSAQANNFRPEHPGTLAVDGFTNTFWVAPAGGRVEPTLVLVFSEAIDLDRAIVRNGSALNFQGSNRAKDLHLVYSTGQSFDVTLKDTPDQQELDIDNGQKIKSVEIHVMSVYQSLQGTDLAISEMEFFTQK
jgi:hypothetical protein